MEKNLPVKIFKKRVNDKRLTDLAVVVQESIGTKFRLQGDALSARASTIKTYLGGMSRKFTYKRERNDFTPTVVQFKLNEHALSKTSRGEVAKLFNVNRKSNLIGLIGDDILLVKIENENDLHKIEQKLEELDKNVVGISAIEEVEDFKPSISDGLSESDLLKVKLFNYGDYKLNEIARRNFEQTCTEKNIVFKRLKYNDDLILYQVKGLQQEAISNFENTEGVFSINKMPQFRVDLDHVHNDEMVNVKRPEEGRQYYRVGIFDDGISDIEHLVHWKDGSFRPYEEGSFKYNHATFIAGIMNYGDELEGTTHTGTQPFKITEAVVFPDPDKEYVDEVMLVEAMENAIKAFPDVKVWNFSIGSNEPINDLQYSDFAAALDRLQDDYNVVIVKAAGNCNNYMKNAARRRIQEASESVRTIVVGSVAHKESPTSLAKYNHPSPFSMTGPGVGGIIKPDVCHYGGNVQYENGVHSPIGVRSFNPTGQVTSGIGTSYSAPRVAAIVAELSGSLKEEFNPLLLKALLVHSAKHPIEFDSPFEDRLSQIGFGIPAIVKDVLYNDPDEVTLILLDTVDKGSLIKIMEFPFPSSLVENDHFYGQIKATLVTNPILHPYQGTEYIQSNVDLAIGTYQEKVENDIGKKKTVKRNAIDTIGNMNLLRPDIYSPVKQRKASEAFKSERILRSYNSEFHPVKKWCIDLDELTDAPRRNYLHNSRHWFLSVEASYREYFYSRTKDNVSQDFALIVTIKDPKKKGNVYNEVTQLLSKYNFIHENIKVDERVILR